MESDYKIVEERADAQGNITYQRVRFYIGAVTTVDEYDYLQKQVVPVTAYRRTEMIDEVEYTYGN
jgi:hypothetical protein